MLLKQNTTEIMFDVLCPEANWNLRSIFYFLAKLGKLLYTSAFIDDSSNRRGWASQNKPIKLVLKHLFSFYRLDKDVIINKIHTENLFLQSQWKNALIFLTFFSNRMDNIWNKIIESIFIIIFIVDFVTLSNLLVLKNEEFFLKLFQLWMTHWR